MPISWTQLASHEWPLNFDFQEFWVRENISLHMKPSVVALKEALTFLLSPPLYCPLRMEESIQIQRQLDVRWRCRRVASCLGKTSPEPLVPIINRKKHQRLPNEIETILNNAQPCRNSSAFYLPSFKKTYLIIFLGAAKRCGGNTPPVAMSPFIKATLKLTEAGTNWIMQQGLGNVAEIWSSQNVAGE